MHRIDIIEPSEILIDRIKYYESKFEKDKIIYSKNTITDKELISKLFALSVSGQQTDQAVQLENYSIVFNCYSNVVPGAIYTLGIRKNGNKLMCGNSTEGIYFEITIDLLEKIAGHTFSIAESSA